MEDVDRILKEATEYLAQAKKLNAAAGYSVEQTEKKMVKINENMEVIVNKLDKAAHDAIRASIDLLKEEIEHRNFDIKDAEDWQDCTTGLYNRSGRHQMDVSIARWQERNKKAEAEIHRLEWQLNN